MDEFQKIKFKVDGDPELGRRVQEALFKLGFTWCSGDVKVTNLSARWLYLDHDGISYTSNTYQDDILIASVNELVNHGWFPGGYLLSLRSSMYCITGFDRGEIGRYMGNSRLFFGEKQSHGNSWSACHTDGVEFYPTLEKAEAAAKKLKDLIPTLDHHNMKFWIGGDIECGHRLQKALFKLGFRWPDGGTKLWGYTGCIYTCSDNELQYTSTEDSYELLSKEDVDPLEFLSIYEEKDEPKDREFKNMKFLVGTNNVLCSDLQKILFKLGYEWAAGNPHEVKYPDNCQILVTYSTGKIKRRANIDDYAEHPNEGIDPISFIVEHADRDTQHAFVRDDSGVIHVVDKLEPKFDTPEAPIKKGLSFADYGIQGEPLQGKDTSKVTALPIKSRKTSKKINFNF